MKFWFLLFVSFSLYAQDWDEIQFYDTPPPFYPFSLSGETLCVNKAPFQTEEAKNQTLGYKQSNLAFSYTHPLNATDGLLFGAGWISTRLLWKENPFFTQTHFEYINLSLGGFTKSFYNWTWITSIALYFDTQKLSLSEYTLYQAVLWGKYQWLSCLELNFGFIAEIGLTTDNSWPIVGFLYIPYPYLRLSVIYPINLSLEYDLFQQWSLALSLRFLRNHHRVGDAEPLSQGIFEYQTWGAEADLLYNPFVWLSFKGFLGSTLPGDLKISNRKDMTLTHFKFKNSFYIGIRGVASF